MTWDVIKIITGLIPVFALLIIRLMIKILDNRGYSNEEEREKQ